jgi:hypothetical protein
VLHRYFKEKENARLRAERKEYDERGQIAIKSKDVDMLQLTLHQKESELEALKRRYQKEMASKVFLDEVVALNSVLAEDGEKNYEQVVDLLHRHEQLSATHEDLVEKAVVARDYQQFTGDQLKFDAHQWVVRNSDLANRLRAFELTKDTASSDMNSYFNQREHGSNLSKELNLLEEAIRNIYTRSLHYPTHVKTKHHQDPLFATDPRHKKQDTGMLARELDKFAERKKRNAGEEDPNALMWEVVGFLDSLLKAVVTKVVDMKSVVKNLKGDEEVDSRQKGQGWSLPNLRRRIKRIQKSASVPGFGACGRKGPKPQQQGMCASGSGSRSRSHSKRASRSMTPVRRLSNRSTRTESPAYLGSPMPGGAFWKRGSPSKKRQGSLTKRMDLPLDQLVVRDSHSGRRSRRKTGMANVIREGAEFDDSSSSSRGYNYRSDDFVALPDL